MLGPALAFSTNGGLKLKLQQFKAVPQHSTKYYSMLIVMDLDLLCVILAATIFGACRG